MSNERLGQLYAILAFLFWGGVSPIYFKEVSSVDAFEVLLYRIVFSLFTLLPFFFFQKNLIKSLIEILRSFYKIKYLFFSTLVVSLNWLIFIWAVSNEKILEASLGYYINPLINVFLGFLVFNERMTKNQYLAIFVALLAVLYQLITLGYIPIVSICLAVSFAIYAMIRKKIEVSSTVGLFVEVLLLFPFALVYLIHLYINQEMAFIQNSSIYISSMLSFSGLMTVVPLLLFNSATTRMKLSTLGFFQYIGPTVAFFVAVFIYKEEFNFDKLVTFLLIWVSLILFSFDSIKKLIKNIKSKELNS